MKILNYNVAVPAELVEHMALGLAIKHIPFELHWLSDEYANITVAVEDSQELLRLKFPDFENEEFIGQQYVVVNASQPAWLGTTTQFNVMPGEDPHTYGSLVEAIEYCQIDMACEHGHTPDSAPVFQLVPVPLAFVQPLFDRLLKEARENEECGDDEE